MKKITFKVILLSVFALVLTPAIAQPPCCPPPPTGTAPLGDINPVLLTSNQNFVWEYVNNHNCNEVAFIADHGVLIYEDFETYNGGQGPYRETNIRRYPLLEPHITVSTGGTHSVTNGELAQLWGYTADDFHVINRFGFFLWTGWGWMEWESEFNGQRIQKFGTEGSTDPCDCIVVFVEDLPNGSGKRIRVENCP